MRRLQTVKYIEFCNELSFSLSFVNYVGNNMKIKMIEITL